MDDNYKKKNGLVLELESLPLKSMDCVMLAQWASEGKIHNPQSTSFMLF